MVLGTKQIDFQRSYDLNAALGIKIFNHDL